jgi:hypothetical protein
MRKRFVTLTAALGLIMSVSASRAALDWTLRQCEEQYGAPAGEPEPVSEGRLCYRFLMPDYEIRVYLRKGFVSRVIYGKNPGFDLAEVQVLLKSNSAEATWGRPEMEENGSRSFAAFTSGVTFYYANLSADGRFLAVWTRAENYIREQHETSGL